MVEVHQEDRGAAERLAIGQPFSCFDCADELAQAFARHRIAAEQRGKLEGARLAIEASAGECVEYEAWHNKHDDGLSGFGHMALGASEVRDNITALSPAKIVGEG